MKLYIRLKQLLGRKDKYQVGEEYEHTFEVLFTVKSKHADPTKISGTILLNGLKKRLEDLLVEPSDNIVEACYALCRYPRGENYE